MTANGILASPRSPAQRVIESAGAQYGGPLRTPIGLLHFFRDPVTGTSLALFDPDVTLAAVELHLKESRERFGVAVPS